MIVGANEVQKSGTETEFSLAALELNALRPNTHAAPEDGQSAHRKLPAAARRQSKRRSEWWRLPPLPTGRFAIEQIHGLTGRQITLAFANTLSVGCWCG